MFDGQSSAIPAVGDSLRQVFAHDFLTVHGERGLTAIAHATLAAVPSAAAAAYVFRIMHPVL
ncbi:MAG: hypothetical protein WBE08_13215 [Methyloceanibacter sp.]|jgi:hypothetical protein